jgi:hypothetical protein
MPQRRIEYEPKRGDNEELGRPTSHEHMKLKEFQTKNYQDTN